MGVSTHSEPKTAFIIGAENPHLDYVENAKRTEEMVKRFTEAGLKFSTLIGDTVDYGKETCFIVIATDDHSEDIISDLCKVYEQDYFLRLENHKHGLYATYKVEPEDGISEFMGYMRQLDPRIIKALGIDSTYNVAINTHFTIWPTDTTMTDKFHLELEIAEQRKSAGLEPLDFVAFKEAHAISLLPSFTEHRNRKKVADNPLDYARIIGYINDYVEDHVRLYGKSIEWTEDDATRVVAHLLTNNSLQNDVQEFVEGIVIATTLAYIQANNR